MRLRNKTAIVTGGTRALGRRIAEALLREGAHVMCASRSTGDMDQIAEIGGGRACFHQVDVCDRASVDALMDAAVDRFGGLDVLVANAGASIDGPIRTLATDDWAAVLDTNLTGTFHCVQAALPHLERRGGAIISVSSALSTRPAPGAAAYSASKAALDMFTRVCAVEFAEHGVRVNAVAPGFIAEGMGARLAADDLVWADYSTRLLTGRPGRGEEVGVVVAFLASDESSYVNGHILEVNGGLRWD